MKIRKIILLSAIAVFAIIFACQLIFSGNSDVKEFKLESDVDSVTIERLSDSSIISVKKTGKDWFVSEKNYPADIDQIDSIVTEIREVKSLGTVSHTGDDERYGLDDASALLVKAYKDGKELRTLRVGKSSSAGSQTYITLDGSKEVLMASGTLGPVFGKTVEDLRNKTIYALNASDIAKIECTKDGKTFAIDKSGENGAWNLISPAGEKAIDPEKAASWAGTLTNLRATGFAPESEPVPSKVLGTAKLTAAGKDIDVSVYDIGDDARYLMTCSESPYTFYVTTYTGGRYTKTLDTLQ